MSASIERRRHHVDDPMRAEDVLAFRSSVRSFVADRVTPNIEAWEEAGEYPWEIVEDMGRLGYLGIGVDEEYGGSEASIFHIVALTEELCRAGALSLPDSLIASAYMVGPYIDLLGTPEQKQRFLAPAVAGREMLAIALTEPDHGSDLAALETRAERDGSGWRLTGQKMFTTSAMRASTVLVAARTTPGAGYRGISLFLVRNDDPGFSVSRRLPQMGLRAMDTCPTSYDGIALPADRLLGPVDEGFVNVMRTMRHERLLLAVMSISGAAWAIDQVSQYVKDRLVFGRPLGSFQVVQHRLVEMATEIEILKRFSYHVANLLEAGQDCTTEVSMLKAEACETGFRVANEALQFFGGYGYISEFPIERMVRDLRMFPIGGGATEVQREIIAKRLGFVPTGGPA